MSNRLVTTLLAVSMLFLFVSNLTLWTWANLVNTERFVRLSSNTLRRDNVREAIGQRAVQEILSDRPIVLAVVERPASAVIAGILGTSLFDTIYRGLATQIHESLVSGRAADIVLDIQRLRPIINSITSILDPNFVPPESTAAQSEPIVLIRAQDLESIHQIATAIPWICTLTGIAGLALLVVSVWKAADLSRALKISGWMLVGTAAVTLLLSLPLRETVLQQPPTTQGRTILGALFQEFSQRLYVQTLLIAIVGAIMVAAGYGAFQRVGDYYRESRKQKELA